MGSVNLHLGAMHAARFAVLGLVMLGVLLIAVLVEQYRICREKGYTDCPSAGHSLWQRTPPASDVRQR